MEGANRMTTRAENIAIRERAAKATRLKLIDLGNKWCVADEEGPLYNSHTIEGFRSLIGDKAVEAFYTERLCDSLDAAMEELRCVDPEKPLVKEYFK
jgi:hypothetical protein